MVHRRTFTRLLATAPCWPWLPTAAQTPPKLPRVGYLNLVSPEYGAGEFRAELAKRGYVAGRDIVFEERYAQGDADKLPALALELVRTDPDVIVAGPASAIRAAARATSTIPIVMAFSGDDPVRNGFVKSLAHPGTNVTGVTAQAGDLAVKWVELLQELVPKLERMAVLANPGQPEHPGFGRTLRKILPPSVRLQWVQADGPGQYEAAFAAMKKERAQSLVIFGDPIFSRDAERIAALALRNRLPAVYLFKHFAKAGGLVSYGPDHDSVAELAADYVIKILKGATPGELPVQQPTRFDMVVNMKTAEALGVTVPASVLVGATEVVR